LNFPFLGSKERDNETGLDYFLARYYSSTQGRFTSPDEFNGGPIELFSIAASSNPTFYADLTNPQSLNKYQYGYNNPLRYTDPDGHAPDGDGITESIKNYLWSLLKDKVNWKTEEEPRRSDPSIAGVPNGDRIVEKHFEALVAISKVNANIISTLDPTGATSVVMNFMQGNRGGTALAAGIALTNIFGVGKGLTTGELLIGNIGKTEVAGQFSKSGSTLVADVVGVFGEKGAGGLSSATKTLFNSIMGYAKQEGLSEVKVSAVAVVNQSLRAKLIKNGWEVTKVKVLGEEVEAFTKTFQVK